MIVNAPDPETISLAPAFKDFKSYLIELTGLGYYQDKDTALAQHVRKRISETTFQNIDQYVDFVRSLAGREELDQLLDLIAIGETYFFRNPAQFDALRTHILPNRIAARVGDKALRIWSAGCASGAEPYSISILLEREWPAASGGWNVQITGSDICERRLMRARQARFSEWEMRGLSDEIRDACFDKRGKNWQLHSRFARRVEFRQQNLKTLCEGPIDDSPGEFDIILCRNVLIYFDVDLMRRVLAKLRSLLVDGGWLIVGHSEPFLEIAHFLTPVSVSGTTVYQKTDNVRSNSTPGISAGIRNVVKAGAGTPKNSHLPFTPPPPFLFSAVDDDAQWLREQAPLRVQPVDDHSGEPDSKTVLNTASAINRVSRLDEARRHADAGNWSCAVTFCEEHIAEHSLDPDGHFILALVHEHRGDITAALEELKRTIYLDRHHALAHFHLGRLYALKGDFQSSHRFTENSVDISAGIARGTAVRGGDGLLSEELESLARQQLSRGRQ